MADFRQQQQAFAAHIRNPIHNPAPDGIEARRLKIYRELFFNNVEGFLSNAFPVLKSILTETAWRQLARDFFSTHACSTPLFSEISQEFLHYLQHERKAKADDPAFMLELAHYEWVEMAVAISDADSQAQAVDPNGDLLNASPALSPTMQNLTYQYPVHQISPEYQPSEIPEQATHLVVYRDRLHEVHFLQINAATQQLIETIKQFPHASGLQIIEQIAAQMQHPEPQVVIQAGMQLLYDLRNKNVVIGTSANQP